MISCLFYFWHMYFWLPIYVFSQSGIYTMHSYWKNLFKSSSMPGPQKLIWKRFVCSILLKKLPLQEQLAIATTAYVIRLLSKLVKFADLEEMWQKCGQLHDPINLPWESVGINCKDGRQFVAAVCATWAVARESAQQRVELGLTALTRTSDLDEDIAHICNLSLEVNDGSEWAPTFRV